MTEDQFMAEIKVPMIAGAKLSIGRWFKRVGEPVTEQEPLVEIDTDSLTHEILSPITGVLAAVLVKDGGSVKHGTLLGIVEPV
jgi:2-oxoglutarate dehydrogenase E2 component (dihydrolipoamide succinyltransferase)